MTLSTVITVILAFAGVALALAVLVLRDVASDLATQEVRAWLPHLSRKIVQRSVQALPMDQRDILEDMESQLSDRSDRPITMLLFAFKVARDRKAIAAEARELALEGNASMSQRSSVTVGSPVAGAIGLISQALIAVQAGAGRVRSGAGSALTLLRVVGRRMLAFMQFTMSGIMLLGFVEVLVRAISWPRGWGWISGSTGSAVVSEGVCLIVVLVFRRQVLRLIMRMLGR
jgi:ABC-type multidrug transport system fused ATPase/permease subunit